MRPLRGVVVGWLVTALSGPSAIAAERVGMPLHVTPVEMPEVTFTDEAGIEVSLADWHGRIVVLNIWATWCGPCRAEMPTLDRLQERLGGETFEVLALSIDSAGIGVVVDFYDEVGIRNLGLYIESTGQAVRTLKVVGIPSTILVGADGRELGRLAGPAEWDSAAMIDFFEKLMRESGQLDEG